MAWRYLHVPTIFCRDYSFFLLVWELDKVNYVLCISSVSRNWHDTRRVIYDTSTEVPRRPLEDTAPPGAVAAPSSYKWRISSGQPRSRLICLSTIFVLRRITRDLPRSPTVNMRLTVLCKEMLNLTATRDLLAFLAYLYTYF